MADVLNVTNDFKDDAKLFAIVNKEIEELQFQLKEKRKVKKECSVRLMQFIKSNKLESTQINISLETPRTNNDSNEPARVNMPPQKLQYVTQQKLAPLNKEYIFSKIKEFMNGDDNLAYQLTCYIFDNRPKLTTEVLKSTHMRKVAFMRR